MSFALLESLRQLSPERCTELLLTEREGQWFDRKSGRTRGGQLAKTLIAFGNAEGGVIAIGIHNGKIEGAPEKYFNEWRQAPLDHTDPPVRAKFEEIKCTDAEGVKRRIMLVEIQPGEVMYRTLRDSVYLRVGDEDRKLTIEQKQELLYDKGQSNYEATAVEDSSEEWVDTALLQSYADSVRHPNPFGLLRARGLAMPSGELTIGGVLLFGGNPQARFPHALVRVVRYQGTERGSGSRQQLLDDVRVEGPIPYVLRDGRAAIKQLMPTRQALGADGKFGPIGLVPEGAWMEGLVNAVVHRSYSMSGDHVRVEIFDDRIEFESPGRFPGLVDVSDPKSITRYARNPRIARVCADLRYGQEFGEGIRRIFEEMRLAGLADPEYVQTSGSVRLILTTQAIDRELEARLPPDGRLIMRAISEIDRPSTGQIKEAVKMSRPALLRRLTALEELRVIEWVGKSPNDPRAYWRVRIDG